MIRLTRLANSLRSPPKPSPLSTFHLRRFLPPTSQTPSSAAHAPISCASFSHRTSAYHRRIDPFPPPNMDPEPSETPEASSAAIEDPDHDFVKVENPTDEILAPAEEEKEVSGAEFLDGDERRVLPEELSRNVVVLTCESIDGGTCDVYLIGTAHVSQESCREVREVISCLKPQVVFLELCSSRVAILTLQDLKVPTMKEMIDMWKKHHNPFGILYSWFLAKVADKLEVLPGSEFRVGYEEGLEWGSKVILGDRPINVTLRRTWGKMPLWHKTKLIYSFIFQAFFLPSSEDLNKMLLEMNDNDMLTLLIQEMSKQFPTLMETLVDERDQYMSSTLLKVASHHQSVVAVVGKGHLQGIKKYWLQPVEMEKLMEIPSASAASPFRILKSLGFAVTGAAIVTGIYLAAKKRS